MNDFILTIGAAGLETGLVLVLVLLASLRPLTRPWVVVIGGAITPFWLFYLYVTLWQWLGPPNQETTFAYLAMLEMLLPAYAGIALLGGLLSLSKAPKHLGWRFVLGLITAPIAYAMYFWGALMFFR